MLTDPLAVTYDGSAKTLQRLSVGPNRTIYRTADREFVITITKTQAGRIGKEFRSISLGRILPDPTPSNSFDDYREITNEFTLSYSFDATRAETSVDIPRLRTALLAFVDSTLQGRLISGEM